MEILVILPCSLFSVHSLICSGSFSSFLISDWTDVCAAAERSSMPKIKKSNRFNIFCYILDRKAPAEWGELIPPWCNQYPSPLRVMNNQGRPAQPPPCPTHPQFFTSSGSESCCCSVFPYYLLWQQHNLPVLSFPSITETGTISTISITSEDFPHGDLFSANHIQPRPPEKENIYGCHSYWFVIIIAVISLSCFVFVSLN